jgi:hypothetical protein
MLTVVQNTPSLLIPKELFKEEKIQEYWSVLHPVSQFENIGKDDLENFFLLYPKPNDLDSMHDATFMFTYIMENYPDRSNVICINVYEKDFNLLALKNGDIVFSGNFQFSVKEDILYYVTNISQQYFENSNDLFYCYQQLSTEILRLLNQYYEVKNISP